MQLNSKDKQTRLQKIYSTGTRVSTVKSLESHKTQLCSNRKKVSKKGRKWPGSFVSREENCVESDTSGKIQGKKNVDRFYVHKP